MKLATLAATPANSYTMEDRFIALRNSELHHVQTDPNLVYGCILITSNKKVLIIKGRCTGKWSFPKGHCNPGETEFECAKRETYEETGITLSNYFQKILHLATGTYFLFSYTEKECIPNDIKEVMDTAWVSFDMLKSMNVNIDISTFIKKYSYLIENSTQRKYPIPIIKKYNK